MKKILLVAIIVFGIYAATVMAQSLQSCVTIVGPKNGICIANSNCKALAHTSGYVSSESRCSDQTLICCAPHALAQGVFIMKLDPSINNQGITYDLKDTQNGQLIAGNLPDVAYDLKSAEYNGYSGIYHLTLKAADGTVLYESDSQITGNKVVVKAISQSDIKQKAPQTPTPPASAKFNLCRGSNGDYSCIDSQTACANIKGTYNSELECMKAIEQIQQTQPPPPTDQQQTPSGPQFTATNQLSPPSPNPVGNSPGCYISIIGPSSQDPTMRSRDGSRYYYGPDASYPEAAGSKKYFFNTETLEQGQYVIQLNDGISTQEFQVNQGSQCSNLPSPSGSGATETGTTKTGTINPLVFGIFFKTIINFAFAQPVAATISPTEQGTIPLSLVASGKNELQYILTLENKNGFAVDARLDSISKPDTLLIMKDASALQTGTLATLQANSKTTIILKVSSADPCSDAGGCRNPFTVSISTINKADGKTMGMSSASAAYTLAPFPSPKITLVDESKRQQEGAINLATSTGSPVDYQFDVYDDAATNTGIIPYDALLTSTVITPKRSGWKVDFYDDATKQKISSVSITQINIKKRISVRVTPPSTAKPADDPQEITVTVKRSKNNIAESISDTETIKYAVSKHGDGICDPGEQGIADCKPETKFSCNFIASTGEPRCENTEDNVINFSARLNVENPRLYDFLVCRNGVSQDDCINSFGSSVTNCGFTQSTTDAWPAKNCMAASRISFNASSKCADTADAYYLLAVTRGATRQTIQSANIYSFQCPYVDIKTIAGIIDNYNKAKTNFDQDSSARATSNSAIQQKQTAGTATSDDLVTKAQNAVCIDTYASLISDITNRTSKLDDLRKNPSISKANSIYGVDAAGRQETLYEWDANFESDIVNRQANACYSGLQSILQISDARFLPNPIKKGDPITLRVTVLEKGTQTYYGTVSCDVTKFGGAKQTIKLQPGCLQISGDGTPFGVQIPTDFTGDISATCTAYGSLSQDCSRATVHDVKNVQKGYVYTTQFSISSISSSNALCRDPATSFAAPGNIPCSVALNGNVQAKSGFAGHPNFNDQQFTCAACAVYRDTQKINECSFVKRDNLSSSFNCLVQGPGTYLVKGYVLINSDCSPSDLIYSAAQGINSSSMLCLGPGDGRVDTVIGGIVVNEECDPAMTPAQILSSCNSIKGRTTGDWTCGLNSKCYDSVPPTVTNVAPLTTVTSSTTTLRVSTNEGATCRYSNESIAYSNMAPALTTTQGMSHSWTLAGLLDGTYTYYISCSDGTNTGSTNNTFDVLRQAVGPGGTGGGTGGSGNGNGNGTSPSAIRLTASNTIIAADGQSTSRITATFLDASGNAMPYAGTITFSTDRGTMLQTSCTADTQHASCFVDLRSSVNSGNAIVLALWNTISATLNIQFSQSTVNNVPPHIFNPQPIGAIPTSYANLQVMTDETATCRYSNVPGIDYDSMNSTTTAPGTSHLWFVSNLPAGVNAFYIRCADSSGNKNLQDFIHTFTVSPGSVPTPQLKTTITNMSIANETLLGTNAVLNVTVSNPQNETRSATVTCNFNSAPKTSGCAVLQPNTQSLIQMTSLASTPGLITISCSVNSTNVNSICQGTVLDQSSPLRAYTTVMEPQMIYIYGRIVPQVVTLNTLIGAQVIAKNPTGDRYSTASCTFTKPGASTVINTSACVPVLSGAQKIFAMQPLADTVGIWTLNSCNVTTSRNSDCSVTDNISSYNFNDQISVVNRLNLTINSIAATNTNVLTGSPTSINVSISNPAGIDKFSVVRCRVTRPNGNQDLLSSACTPVSMQTTKSFLVGFTPSISGIWTVSSCSVEGSLNSDCSSSAQEDNAASGQQITVSSQQQAFIPISVSVSHAPQSPNLGDTVAITASSPSTNIRQITISVDGVFKTCSTSPCTYSSTYRTGPHYYYAIAQNTFLQEARDPVNGTNTFIIGLPSNATSSGACSINITSPSCKFNQQTNRYDVAAVFNWAGGDHTRTIIDGIERVQVANTLNFTYSEPLPAPGTKSIIAKVQDASNRDICSTYAQAVCNPAVPVQEINITREMPDVSKTGFLSVRLNIAPGRDILNFTLKEHLIQGLLPLNIAVQGNTSYANITGPRSVSLDKDFSQYTFATNLQRGRNISITYRVNIQKEGEYDFMSVGQYEGKTVQERQTVLVTNCAKPIYTLAVSPDGECKKFRTDCEVPFDWRKVDQCPLLKSQTNNTSGQKPSGGNGTIAVIITVIALVALIILTWRYEDEIKARIKKIKQRIENWRSGDEEKKPWENEDNGNAS